jgi:lysozyme family protein
MIKVVWNDALKADYQNLFETCVVKNIEAVDSLARRIAANKQRYCKIAKSVNPDMPWWFVGCVHHMECGLRFDRHLHNGDPLVSKTVHVPVGRPPGLPPWTFEDSAYDALVRCRGLNKWHDWSVPAVLYLLEGYNGYGYRQYHPQIKSPYLWAFTNHYDHGKYVADGKWSETAVSLQIGIAAVVKRLLTPKVV